MLLGSDAELEVAGVHADCGDCVSAAQRVVPDIVLVDLAFSESIEAIAALTETVPGARTVAVSVAQDERCVVDCARAGVAAFMSREATVADLRKTILETARGEHPGPSWLMPMLLRRVASDREPSPCPSVERLTRREREVLDLVADGLSNKQIARRLRIELPTVKNHVHSILEKLDVSRRSQAVAYLHRGRLRAEI
jgi:two-component system, NarL family, nitrate/nitrite response regulator NarL